MYKVIEDFSIEVPTVTPKGEKTTKKEVDLVVEKWNIATPVAYTYNGDDEGTATQLYIALKKYKELYFDCEVDDWREIRRIHQTMRDLMTRLYGSRVEVEAIRNDTTLLRLRRLRKKQQQ